MHYVYEFLGLMAVFSVLVVSPGADFLLVVRQSLVHGRRAAIVTSFGIGASLLFHIGYTILGIGIIVAQSLFLFGLLKWAGAAYLLYLGWKSLRADAFEMPDEKTESQTAAAAPPSTLRLFLLGFATNALNPKPVLFFLSLFTALVSHDTPAPVQAIYGLLMAATLILWFVGVSTFFTVASVRERFVAWGRWFNRITGMIFIGLGIRLATQQAS
ncbi:LysE family translocator [Mesorhizobium sp. UC22_110]|uniref:LysE family translocator n=1 Tax=unclassified Mesorhizobium TaxID=325217 RepID=UPI00366E10D2